MPETKAKTPTAPKKPAIPSLQEKFNNVLADLRSGREDALPIFLKEQLINFDVISEEETQHTTFRQHTKDGTDRLVWIYEADLTVRWTNAEKPSDQLESKIHAIGTSDKGPATAKMAAWDGTLAAYFGSKFWQPIELTGGYEEDYPSMLAALATQGAAQRPAQPRNAPEGINTQENAKNAPQRKSDGRRTLTGPQIDRMYRKAEAAGITMQQVDAELRKRYNAEDPHTITRQQYDEICKELDDMARNRQQGGQPNE